MDETINGLFFDILFSTWETFFLRSSNAIFFKVLVNKNRFFFRILHEILSGNQLWLIFFGPLIRVLGGVKVEKVKILTKTLKVV
jgi:hypothetical protein